MARLSLFIYGMQTASPSPNSLFSPRVAGYGGGGGGAQITAKETFAASDGAAERELFPTDAHLLTGEGPPTLSKLWKGKWQVRLASSPSEALFSHNCQAEHTPILKSFLQL